MRQLRPHQEDALNRLRLAVMAGKRRPMVQAPTGFGKTVLSGEIVRRALDKGNRVIFTVPAISLIDQTVHSLYADGITDVGVIQADHPETNWLRKVQVASVQSLQRRRIPPADLVLIDEAHRWFKFYETWMAMGEWRNVPFVGLSATPWTRGLGKHFDELIVAATLRELIEEGYLSDYRVFAPSKPDLSGVRVQRGDYREDDLSKACDTEPLVADIVRTWLDRGQNRPTLCFAVDRAHAAHLQRRFEAAGVPTGYVDCYTTSDERKKIALQFKHGEIKVVCNVGTLTTGVDWDVRCIILARPTKSEMLYVQIFGRGLRTAEGKDYCLVLDHSDTTARLGFPDSIVKTSLDTGKKAKSSSGDAERPEPLPKSCPSCSFVKPPRVHECPNCGFAPQQQSAVKTVDGELVEVKKAKGRADKATKQRWYSMLLWVAHDRGYSSGWAAHKYRAKFDVWPRGLDEIVAKPDAEVLGFIRHLQIKFAKQREKEQRHAA
jgi:DNA repair protein RadD